MRALFLAAIGGVTAVSSNYAENLLQNASFELPTVTERTPAIKGANPGLVSEGTSWTNLKSAKGVDGGELTVGLTNEIAHTGKQSIFVDFKKVTGLAKRATLVGNLLQIQPSHAYRISIWGRTDKTRSLTMDERRPHMLVEVEYFTANQVQVGQGEFRTQMIPGSILPSGQLKMLFVPGSWNEYFTDLRSPANAVFMKVSFHWETPRLEGETDGVLYLDDAVVEGPRGTVPITDPPETDEADTAEEAEEPEKTEEADEVPSAPEASMPGSGDAVAAPPK